LLSNVPFVITTKLHFVSHLGRRHKKTTCSEKSWFHWIEQTRLELTGYLATLQARYTSPDVTIQAHVLRGDETSLIIETAVAEQVDLIVMSSHGRSGLSRLVFGSVTEDVVQRAPCPVWVIRQAQIPSRIVITLDGSRYSETALKPGARLARQFGSQVTLLRAFGSEAVDAHLRCCVAPAVPC
jgi:nucleotide-binding universal stress UspA family protein